MMKFKITALVLALAVLAGCAKWKSADRKTKGAVIGATSGAVIGGLLGRGGKNTALGVILGATVGGAAGAVIGFYMDKQKKDLEKDLEKENEKLPPDQQIKVERVGEGINLTMGSGILFDVNKSNLKPGIRSGLGSMSQTLNKYDETYILITGHTDADGTSEHNHALSERRAQAVANELVGRGVARERLVTRGLGEEQPVADNTSAGGKQKNRRVEISIIANEKLKEDAKDGNIEGQ
ncbi:MAG: OmpA family protein [Bernardetiaceae bacterium]|jgi:outer membrane protein OmpA-like peptidoglycan-associated protein|nr:OmpA family protein [Bernardetiaceae bacterium]